MSINERKNNELNCEIVRDLLPLYHDKVVSDTTQKAVAEHLEDCKPCQKEYEDICREIDINKTQKIKENKFFKTMNTLKKKGVIKGLTIGLSITAAVILILSVGFFALFEWNIKPIPKDSIKVKKTIGYNISDSKKDGFPVSLDGQCWYICIDINRNYSGQSKSFITFDEKTNTMNIDYKTPVITDNHYPDNGNDTIKYDKFNDVITNDTLAFDSNKVDKVALNGEMIWEKSKDGFTYDNETIEYIKDNLNGHYKENYNVASIEPKYEAYQYIPDNTVKIWDIENCRLIKEGKISEEDFLEKPFEQWEIK